MGLAERGLRVVATDASDAMVRRTAELAEQFGAPVRTLRTEWQGLPDHFEDDTFDMVFCVGNSLHHAQGEPGRAVALQSMAQLLRPGGRLVLTSRDWELVRAKGSRLDVGNRLVRRHGRDALVVYRWEIAARWEDEHHIEIAVVHLAADGSAQVRSEVLSCWPFRHDELDDELRRAGLRTLISTYDPAAENYTLVASESQP